MNNISVIKHNGREIFFEIIRTNSKKTIQIIVTPECKVIIRTPINSDIKYIESIVLKRSSWIIEKIQHIEKNQHRFPIRKFTHNTEHMYLGSPLTLQIKPGTKNIAAHDESCIYITSKNHNNQDHIKILMNKWYRNRAEAIFHERLTACLKYFGLTQQQITKMTIRYMKTRWGSLSGKGNINLNLELIKTQIECIDYVIVHELCHIYHRNHGPEFYKLLEKIMPDWKERKRKLKESRL